MHKRTVGLPSNSGPPSTSTLHLIVFVSFVFDFKTSVKLHLFGSLDNAAIQNSELVSKHWKKNIRPIKGPGWNQIVLHYSNHQTIDETAYKRHMKTGNPLFEVKAIKTIVLQITRNVIKTRDKHINR